MEAADQTYLGTLPSLLVSTTNMALARPILWGSLGLFGLTGFLLFVRFMVRLGPDTAADPAARPQTPQPAPRPAPQPAVPQAVDAPAMTSTSAR